MAANKAELAVVTTWDSGDDRGDAIRRRFEALGISEREWHDKTKIDRKTLQRAMRNEPGTRPSTYDAIETNLDRLEAMVEGRPIGAPAKELVTFRLKGDFGVEVVVEGPVEDREALEASVTRLIREMRRGSQSASE